MASGSGAYSMTGYGRGMALGPRFRVTVELRTVNGRFLEVRPKLPRALAFLEPAARAAVEKKLTRGVVDVVLLVQPLDGALDASVNVSLAKSYLAMARQVAEATGLPLGLNAEDVMRLPGVLAGEDPISLEKETEIPPLADQALAIALEQLLEMRRAEGAKLTAVITRELAEIREGRDWVHTQRVDLNEKYLTKIRARMKDWTAKSQELSEARLHQEVAFYIDRSDVTEELDRLGSHLEQAEETLRDQGVKSVGKRLEFLTQELGREVNTIGSKSDLLPVTQRVLAMKLAVEKIREQVQNLE